MGIDLEPWGRAVFTWAGESGQAIKGTTVWSIVDGESDYLAPSSALVINYGVADPEGDKIELWQPPDGR